MSICRKAGSLIAMSALAFCSCGLNPQAEQQLVKSGFKKIPETLQIERLFGEANHFISYGVRDLHPSWDTDAKGDLSVIGRK